VRILVIDDNVDAAETLAAMLRTVDHEVVTAHGGFEGLHQAHRMPPPQVVFLDIGMPGLNGYDVARGIRSARECSKTYIIALTGHGTEQDKRKAFEAGMDRHLTKPAEPGLIVELMRQLSAGN
jgi:CheY-like chemotaxis protein